MSTDPFDPFGAPAPAPNPTKVVPRPGGGRRAEQPRAGAAPAQPDVLRPGELNRQFVGTAGGNKLLNLATPLLSVMHRLRTTADHRDPVALRTWLEAEVKSFRERAAADPSATRHLDDASYLLCAALDEAVLTTPWGANSGWRTNNLLNEFHGGNLGSDQSIWAGDETFKRASALMPESAQHVNQLELFHACLSLGYQGRYGATENGEARLKSIREQVYQTIDQQRSRPERDLSVHWHGVRDYRNPVANYVPIWVVVAAAVALLGGLFWWFSVNINDHSLPVMRSISEIAVPEPFTRRVEPPPPRVASTVPTLRELLAADIADGHVDVIDGGAEAIVRLRGDGLFASGKASVRDAYRPVLIRVASALDEVTGPVTVNGHTDSIPIHTARWPSNYELSEGRAVAVSEQLAQAMDQPQRLTARGRGDVEPVADNATRKGQAANRRVDLRLPNR